MIGYNIYQQVTINQEATKVARTNRIRRQQIKTINTNNQQPRSQNEIETANSQLSQQQATLNDLSQQFFMTALTFDSQKTWLKRATKLKPICSDELLKDQNWFNDGLDNTGHSIVEAKELASQTQKVVTYPGQLDGDVITGLALVTIKSQESGHGSATSSLFYQIQVNVKTKRIQAVQKLGTQSIVGENQGG